MESLDRLGELPDFVRSSAPAARKPSGGTSTSIDQRDHRHEIHELPSRLLRSASTESPGAVLSEEDVAAIMTAVTRGEAFNDLIDASDTDTLDKACRAFRLERFAAGATVCTEGILATVFYVVASGEFESDSPWPWGYSRHTYRAGSCFGDEALLGGCEHEHTFTCVTAGKVWALDHLIFRRILAEKNTLAMQRKASQLQLSDMDGQGSHGARGTPPPDAFDMRHLTALGWLGDGAFGVVWRVRHKPSGEAYALKCMERSRLRRPQDADGVLRERQILGLLAQREHAHALIVRAAAFFRGHLDDREGLYMLLELMSGGDLKAKLERLRCLPPSCCAFYAACTSAALLHLHALDIVYRDLKPENLVIDHSGYLKLIDFGLSKVLSSSADGRTWTLCGTPHFMAPEIIRGRGYGTSADWWALGILTYEMLTGACPFEGETQAEIFKQIMSTPRVVHYPPELFPPEGIHFVQGLLVGAPSKRLGGPAVHSHPFISAYEPSALLTKELQPPSDGEDEASKPPAAPTTDSDAISLTSIDTGGSESTAAGQSPLVPRRKVGDKSSTDDDLGSSSDEESKMMKVVVAGAAGQNNTGDASLPSWADFEPLVVYRDLDEEDAFAGFAWPGTTPSVAIS